AGNPDDFSGERGAPEDAVGEHLHLVHGTVIEMEPNAASFTGEARQCGEPGLEHGEQPVEAAPRVGVCRLPELARAIAEARSVHLARIEGRIDVGELEAVVARASELL